MAREPKVVVTVDRWRRGLVLSIDGVGVTQCHGWWDAELMVRDYLACFGRQDAETIGIEFVLDAAVMRPSVWRRRLVRSVAGFPLLARAGAGEVTESDGK